MFVGYSMSRSAGLRMVSCGYQIQARFKFAIDDDGSGIFRATFCFSRENEDNIITMKLKTFVSVKKDF